MEIVPNPIELTNQQQIKLTTEEKRDLHVCANFLFGTLQMILAAGPGSRSHFLSGRRGRNKGWRRAIEGDLASDGVQ